MRKAALTALLLALTAAPAAGAQEGVFVDPDSPAGTEYALPLDRARGEAAPDAGGREGGGDGSEQPLFGVGIDQSRGSPEDQDGRSTGPGGEEPTGSQDSSNQGGQGGVRRQDGSGDSSSRTGDLAPNAYRPAAIEAAASEGSDVLLTAGIAAAVLGVGFFAGFGLRRLLRDSKP